VSGIGGLLLLDGAPVDPADLQAMATVLTRRGPDGAGVRIRDGVGLVHTRLAAIPGDATEQQPLAHAATGCLITADVRLDNRDELLGLLGCRDRASALSDAGLVLEAYLRWDVDCASRLLGDFAFAIWDPRVQRLFAARDHFGLRPLYYHYAAQRLLALASEPKAILVLDQVPYRINEGRVADYLVADLEGIDQTSTFFEQVVRLPPAHVLLADRGGLTVRRYWSLTPGPLLHLASDAEYAEAFLDVFGHAVRDRLRTTGPVGSMLSGGMDSGSVVAVASEQLAAAGRPPLQSFSATSPPPQSAQCVETQAIHAAMQMPHLDARAVHYGELAEYRDDLVRLHGALDEPFDGGMVIPRLMYLMARRAGVNVVLDGATGDVVLGEATHLARLVRSLRWGRAIREARGQARFWRGGYPAWQELYYAARSAATTDWMRTTRAQLTRDRRAAQRATQALQHTFIGRELAERVQLSRRFRDSDHGAIASARGSYGLDCARVLMDPQVTVGRERYGRVASALGIEARDPFLDVRVVDLVLRLPGSQKLRDGWPKFILRSAMAGKLPDAVRWRRGKEHLGWDFTRALMEGTAAVLRERLDTNLHSLAPFVNMDALIQARDAYFIRGELAHAEHLNEVSLLGEWLRSNADRPRVRSTPDSTPGSLVNTAWGMDS
jgi:asparagine synthase (glutamine-hydrolysing)